jgi:hypothetical protein
MGECTHDLALTYTFCGTHGVFPIPLFASPAPAIALILPEPKVWMKERGCP